MTIKAENSVTREDINAFMRCSSAKSRFIILTIGALFLLFSAFSIIVGSMGKNFSYCLMGIIWCVLVYFYIFAVSPVLSYRSFCRRYGSDALVQYEITEDKLFMTVKSGDRTWEKTAIMEEMFKAVETDDYFFIYMKRNESFIMHKKGFISGTPDDLAEMLIKKLGRKYNRR